MDDRLELKIIVGFGETENGIPMTIFYYEDKIGDWGTGDNFDIDRLALEDLLGVGYATYFTLTDIMKITQRGETTAKRLIKKLIDKDILVKLPMRKKGKKKIEKTVYYFKDGIYGIEQTKRLYGTDDFYRSAKFAAETDVRNFIDGYPKPKGNEYYYGEDRF